MVAALLLSNVCRVAMAVAIVPMAAQFGWGPAVQGLVQSSYLWGYTATQFGGGLLADRHGGKRVLGAGFVVSALTTAATPLIVGGWGGPGILGGAAAAGMALPALALMRGLVGAGQGVSLPSMNALVTAVVPRSRRASTLGANFSGFHTGTLLGLLAAPPLLAAVGWPALFGVFGLACAPAAALWYAAVPDYRTPAQGGRRAAVGALLSHPGARAIFAAHAVNHWGYFLYLSWMPTYFKALGLSLSSAAYLAFLPWLVMAIMSTAAGTFADSLLSRGVCVLQARRLVQGIAFWGAAAALLPLAASASPDPRLALGSLMLALAFQAFGQAGFMPNMGDVAPRHVGTLFGVSNTFGSCAGIASTVAAGVMLERTGSWQLVWGTAAAVYAAGAVVFSTFSSVDEAI